MWSFLERYINILGKEKEAIDLKSVQQWGSTHQINETAENSMWRWETTREAEVICVDSYTWVLPHSQQCCERPKDKPCQKSGQVGKDKGGCDNKGASRKWLRKRRLGKAWGQQVLNTRANLEEWIRPKQQKQHWTNKVDAKKMLPHTCFMLLVFWSMSSTERINRDLRE